MSKVGVSLKIDVTKIDKEKLFKGAKGTYLDAQVFINLDEEDQYGNHGMITQAVKQGEDKNSGAILGNCKVFWREQSQPSAPSHPSMPQQPSAIPPASNMEAFDDDIPF